MLRALTGIRLAEIDRLIQPNAEGDQREALDKELETVCDDLAAVSDALTAQYFRHEEQPHNLLSRGEGL
jgi:hypothetical protein